MSTFAAPVAPASTAPVAQSYRLPRLSLEVAGLLTLLLGAWAGIVVFVGPLFSFSADGSPSWHWSLAHALLFVVPGAGAVVAGLFAMIGALANRKGLLATAGLLAAVCGAWLVIGLFAWPLINGTSYFRTGVTNIRQFEYVIGYSLGPGALLVALGAFMLGRDRYSVPVAAAGAPAGSVPTSYDSAVAGSPPAGSGSIEREEPTAWQQPVDPADPQGWS